MIFHDFYDAFYDFRPNIEVQMNSKVISEHLNLKMVFKSCLFQSRQKKANKNHPQRPW